MESERPKAVGLNWRPRETGPDIPVWIASKAAIKAGYEPKTVNLTHLLHAPVALIERCDRLQHEMNLWMERRSFPERRSDGSFKYLLEIYQSHPKSSFNRTIKPGTRKLYAIQLKKLIPHIGDLQISKCNGIDVLEWFADWRIGRNGKDQLPTARVILAVLEAAVSLGVILKIDGASEFQVILLLLHRNGEFPKPKPRTYAPTADQIIAARKAAHANKRPRRALLYALQFETTARQYDWNGVWLPMDDPRFSDITDAGMKWVGPRWSDMDENLVLTIKPTKTEDTTEVEVSYDLSACPMVVEELAMIPQAERKGPLIINEGTRLPYHYRTFLSRGWRKDYADAGIPKEIWNRDTRSGGITEGALAKAPRDDRRRLAGHSKEEQTGHYERGAVDLEAHRSVMAARKKFREKNNK